MVKFLTTKGVASHIEEVIRKATKQIFLLSPFLQLSDSVLDRLQRADQIGKRVTLVYGKKEQIDDKTLKQLQTIKGISLLYCPNMHAKCYFSEHGLVIASMNLYQFSEINNKEMGVYFDSVDDATLYKEAQQEALDICISSKKINISEPASNLVSEPLTPYKVTPQRSIPAPQKPKICPRCHTGELIPREAKKGAHKGETFWGCSNFPKCRYNE